MEITGRLTRDAQVRSVGEKNVVNFSVAVNDSYKKKAGERITQTEFFDCSFWLGTGIAPYLTKGSIVELYGRVSARAYTANDGSLKAALQFNTARIKFHGSNKPEGQTQKKPMTSPYTGK